MAEEVEGTKAREEYLFTRFYEICDKYPRNTAIIYLGEEYSYAELRELIERFGTGLSELGVKKGDRVILYTTNCPQWLIAFFGIQIIGAHAVPVSPIYTSHEVEYMANDCGAETVVCLDTNYCYVREILPTTPIKRVIVTNLVDLLPAYKRLIGFLFDKVPHGSYDKDAHIYKFKKMLSYPPNPPKVGMDAWDDIAYILYTGGTTGFPKGVPLNHIGVTSYLNEMAEHVLDGYVREGGDTFVCVNPLFHIMAFAYFAILVLNRGNTGVLMPAPQIDAILEAIDRHDGTLFLGVPVLYRMVLENDRLGGYDLSSLRYSFCGGDKLPTEIFRRWKEKFGIPIHQVYGSTEVGFVTHHKLNEDPDPENLDVGRPLPSRKCLVCDPDTLEPVPEGETGELLVTSDYIIKEYLNKPEETARSFVKVGHETYYRMGDFVQIDSEGRVYYVERSADIIKYKGYRVSASEIEAVLQDHEAVIAACAVGVPDPKVGERIKAMVVLKEDARGVGAADLLKFCRGRLASYKMPKYIEFRDMLPKSKVGKLLRREVRDEEDRKAEKEKKIAL
ncbi:MAG: class I adenylate-forming enzyme family protein [Desulfobacteraceae bacterium]|jgi:long-chain acyl-CoA synthetase